MCPGCFGSEGKDRVCPACGFDTSAPQSPLALPLRTVLKGQYVVGRILGKPGGFGITYLGWDLQLETTVAVKEYLPRELAGRANNHTTVQPHSDEDANNFAFGLGQFVDEARTLARFDHLNVVRCRTFLEANGTAYLVMDYYEGMSLAEYLAGQGGTLPGKLAIDIMMPVMDGIEALKNIRGDIRLRATPIVMLTSTTDVRMVTEAIESGANDYIAKPFSVTLLTERVERYIHAR